MRGHEYPDGTVAVFPGPWCLARDDAEGRLIEPEDEAPRRKTPPPRLGDRLIVDPGAMVRDIFSAHG